MNTSAPLDDVRVEPGAQPGDLVMRSVGGVNEYYRVVGRNALVKIRPGHAQAEIAEQGFLRRLGDLCAQAVRKTKEQPK